jgi:hypothetical protein
MVGILTAVTSDGVDAFEAACAEALAGGPVSCDVIINILTRQRQPPAPLNIVTPDALLQIPRSSRPLFRDEAGRDSEMKPATIPR